MSLTRRAALVLGFGATVLTTSVAFAATHTAFTQTSFDAANAAGKPILVEVTAPWCPTCKAQAPIWRTERSSQVQRPAGLQSRLRHAKRRA